MEKSLLEIIVCPVCHGGLKLLQGKDKLLCKFDRLLYNIDDGIPMLLADKAESLTAEQVKQLK